MDIAKDLEVSCSELAAGLEAGESIQLLDIRATFKLANGRIDYGAADRFFNVPGSVLHAMADLSQIGLEPAVPVVTVCNHGNQSIPAALLLRMHGYAARSLHGGMAGWMNLLIPRKLTPPTGFDQLIQFDRIGKGSLGYLLVSGDAAFAIDMPRYPQPVVDWAAKFGARLIGIADTHVHADYISGGPMLSRRLQVPYFLHQADGSYPYDDSPGRLEFSHCPDGWEFAVGKGRVSAKHMPGHTKGSLCFQAGDAVFTGDLVFIDSVGRPDLAGKTAEWSVELFASLKRARQEWQDELMVYPAHYGSEAERNPDLTVGRSFGQLKRENPHLGIADQSEFVDWVSRHVSTPPPEYKTIKGINISLLEVTELEAEELEYGRNECALISPVSQGQDQTG